MLVASPQTSDQRLRLWNPQGLLALDLGRDTFLHLFFALFKIEIVLKTRLRISEYKVTFVCFLIMPKLQIFSDILSIKIYALCVVDAVFLLDPFEHQYDRFGAYVQKHSS